MDKKKVVTEKKVVKKSASKNTKNKKIDYAKVVSNEKFLLGVLILLAILVCVLGCLVIKQKNNT